MKRIYEILNKILFGIALLFAVLVIVASIKMIKNNQKENAKWATNQSGTFVTEPTDSTKNIRLESKLLDTLDHSKFDYLINGEHFNDLVDSISIPGITNSTITVVYFTEDIDWESLNISEPVQLSGPYLNYKERKLSNVNVDILGLKDPKYIEFTDSLNGILTMDYYYSEQQMKVAAEIACFSPGTRFIICSINGKIFTEAIKSGQKPNWPDAVLIEKEVRDPHHNKNYVFKYEEGRAVEFMF